MAEMVRLFDFVYGHSPMKCPSTDKNKENTVHFCLKPKLRKSSNSLHYDELVGAEQEKLASVIVQKYPEMKVEKFLFRARIRGRGGLSCVDPFLLPCGSIEPNTEVLTEVCDNIYNNVGQKLLEIAKPYSKPQSEVVTFFIVNSTDDRKNKQGITNVHYRTMHCDMICVVGFSGQTVRQALSQDGRFSNIDRFIVNRKIEGGLGPNLGIDELVEHFDGDILQIKVRKVATVDRTLTAKKHTTSESSGAGCILVASTGRKNKKTTKEVLAKKMLEEDAVYLFTKKVTELTSKEMLSEMKECLEALACFSLVDRRGKQAIASLSKTEFANQSVTPRPVSFSKKLYKLFDSVGQIRCGSVEATCFLVSNDMIVTNFHVVQMIVKAKHESLHGNHTKVFAYFDHEEPDGTESSHEYRLLEFTSKGNILSKKLDYAFLHLENPVERKTLGEYVSCAVPVKGKVCILGYPSNAEKQDEVCPILPLHGHRKSLEIEKRVSEKENQCEEAPYNPSKSTLASTSQDNPCIHKYIPSIRKLKSDGSAITDDVGSMFKGLSGAPVFNMNCEIVALHSAGFRLDSTIVLEIGITFATIIRDLRRRGYSEFVDEHFTNRREEGLMEYH